MMKRSSRKVNSRTSRTRTAPAWTPGPWQAFEDEWSRLWVSLGPHAVTFEPAPVLRVTVGGTVPALQAETLPLPLPRPERATPAVEWQLEPLPLCAQ